MRRLTLDLLGTLLMVAAPFVGILPGPGGLLVFIAGLWLLARNHGWAQRLLDTIKDKGLNLLDIIFVDKPLWHAVYDIMSLVLISVGIYILNTRVGTIPIMFGTFLNLLGLSIALYNRRRLQRMTGAVNDFMRKKSK